MRIAICQLSKFVLRLMLILRFGLAHVLFSNFAHMCLRIVPLTDNSKLIIKIPMIMKNQLLNLKMIALMCLMMVLGGGESMGTGNNVGDLYFGKGCIFFNF